MAVQAINENRNHSALPTVVASTAVGGLAGYAAKYLLPLTTEERDDEFKKVLDIIRKESKKTKDKSIEEIRSLPKKTLAQDTFLKMVDAEKPASQTAQAVEEGIKVANGSKKGTVKVAGNRASNMRAMMKKLGDVDKIELRNIINDVNEPARRMSSRCISAYEGVIKKIRPAAAFILPGVALGFIFGVGRNILSTETEFNV